MDREDKVVSYRNSTSNHNTSVSNAAISSLYLIEILHQTTTNQWRRCNTGSCILSKFYIKPQHWQDEAQIDTRCILSKFYIKPQQRQRFLGRARSCILSKFYIKPQHSQCVVVQLCSCILSKFYIKPQLRSGAGAEGVGCILSKFYIKPQLGRRACRPWWVVSYRNSTSNHNRSRTPSTRR